jgi:hypothetical protein
MTTFLDLIDAVEENNRINDGKWSDWENAAHIQEVYGALSYDEDIQIKAIEKMLNFLIKSNGEDVNLFIDLVDHYDYGIMFARSGRRFERVRKELCAG